MASYDIIGSIAIIKSEGKTKKQKLEQAKHLLKQPSIKTIVEKATDVKGRLRTIKTKHIAGIKNLITVYKENNCSFKLNVETCYFSPRLSNDRKEVAKKIKISEKVLVMFAGVGPYPIVIYKLSKPREITAIEIGKDCCKYFKENLKLNKIPENKIKIIQGDVKKKITKQSLKQLGKFDKIMMARPNLKNTFLEQALLVSKKNTIIFYHGFTHQDNLKDLTNQLEQEAKNLKRKIKITNITKAGDIAPFKYRYRIEIKVLK
ncbi:MAG: hypothetical protein ABIH37_05565 [archaeon]